MITFVLMKLNQYSKHLSYLLVLFAALLFKVGLSQQNLSDPQEYYQFGLYHHQKWTSTDNLPLEFIRDIDQDTLGYIWLATEQGVSRFDGQHFRHYNMSNTPVLVSDLIYQVEVAHSGKIWLGGPSGLYVYHHGQFSLWKDKTGKTIDQIVDITADSEDRIWISSVEKLFVLDDDELRQFDIHGLSAVSVFGGRKNKIWVLCIGNILLEIADDHIIKKHDVGKYIETGISSLFEDDQGGLYFGAENSGLHYWKDGNGKKLLPGRARALIMDNDNNLWMGSSNALVRYNDNGIDQFGEFDGLTDSHVSDLFKDMHGDIWVGTRQGLNLFSRTPVKAIRFWKDQKSKKTKINTIIEDKKGVIWAGSISWGIYILKDDQVVMPKQNKSEIGTVIYCLYQNKGMYVGSNQGLFKVALQKDSIVVQQQISDHVVYSFFIASDDTKWLSTWTVENGNTVFFEKNGTPYELEKLHGIRVFWFEEYAPGEITMGTNQGIFLWKNGRVISLNATYQLPVDRYFAQYYDSLNNIKLFGTHGSGLIKMVGEKVSVFNSKNGFPINSIRALHPDDHGGIWIAGHHEVFHIPIGKLTYDDPSGTIKHKFTKYRLLGRIDPVAYPNMELTSNGKLLIATNNGIDELDPKQKMDRSIPMLVESFIVDDERISFNTPFEISASSKKVSIQFTAIDFLNGPDLNYEYRLKGFEEKWTMAGSNKTAVYTNLPSGEYYFEVRARNSHESPQVEALPVVFEKRKHWYYTWPMLIVYGFLIILIIRMLVFFRTRNIKQKNIKLQKKVNDRTKELKDININLEQKVKYRTLEISEINKMLAAKEERLSLTLEKTNTGLFEWYPMTSQTYFSPTWFTMLGYEPDEFPHSYETWANLLHPEDRPIIEKIVDDFIRIGGDDFTAEFRMLSKQGEYYWIYDHSVAVERDKHGRLIRMAGIHSDITKHKLDEEKIRLKETRYQSFVANSSEHIWCVDFYVPIPLDLPEMEQVEHILEHGYYSEANEAFAQAYGATVEEVIGWPFVKTLPRELPTTIPTLLEVVRSGYRLNELKSVEEDKDGSQIILLNNFVGTIEDNKVLRVWGTARDVTDKMKAEEKLKLNEEKLKNILQNLPDSVSRYEFQPKRGFSFISSMTDIYGYPPEDFFADPDLILKIVHPDDRHLIDTYLERLVNNEMPFIMRYIHKNGKTIVTEARSIPIYNDKGELIANDSITRDITEIKKAEKDLIESEERYKLALDVSNDGIWDWNIKENIAKFSPSIYTMLGFKPFEFEENLEEVIQRIHPDDQETRNLDHYRSTMKHAGDSQVMDEFRMVKKSGEIIWVQFKAKVVKRKDDGKPLRIIGTLINVSAIKRKTQELIEAILTTEDKERSRISKELHDGLQQTLLVASLNFQSVKKEINGLDIKTRDKFESGLKSLQDSISESRSMAHSLMPKAITDHGVISAFENLVENMDISTEQTQFMFHHNFKTRKLDNQAIEITLFRVVQESVNNIVKYARAANVDIQLKDYEDMYLLTIEDDGIGFDVDKMKKEHPGLGFKTIENRLDAINGMLEIESSPGKGTVIIVRINK